MGKELQEGLDDYQKKQALLAPQVKADKEKSLQELQQRARDYQYQKFDQREGEAVKLREKKFAPIQDRKSSRELQRKANLILYLTN